MADKKYYWLKLQDDFFSSKRIKKLRRLAGGDTFTIIYLKMQLLSLKSGGYLEFTGLEEDFSQEIALDIDEDAENVKLTVAYLLSCGLLETSDDIEYFLPFVAKCTGSETKWAEKKRAYRSKQDNGRTIEGHCPREIDIEKEIDIDKDILSGKEKVKTNLTETAKEIIDYFNSKCGTNYRAKSTKTQGLIKARMNDGFSIEDFKIVIDKKWMDWHDKPDMVAYLRPETLFSNKFEGYLNQKVRGYNDAGRVAGYIDANASINEERLASWNDDEGLE